MLFYDLIYAYESKLVIKKGDVIKFQVNNSNWLIEAIARYEINSFYMKIIIFTCLMGMTC